MNIRLPNSVAAALGFLFLVLLIAAFVYGVIAQRFRVFPYALFSQFETAVSESIQQGQGELPWYYQPTDRTSRVTRAAEFADERLNLVTSMGPDDQIMLSVIDGQGEVRNEIAVDWFDIWPDPQHLPASDIPKSRPGTHVHGAVMLANGDVVFNFEQLGLVRMTPCGELVWKLPYRTHHSVYADAQGDLWVSGQITHQAKLPDFPNHKPPFREPTVLKVSADGEILEEISVFDVLVENDLRAYLHLVTAANRNTIVTGDTLHLNDVEIFSADMEEGVFRHGDIMISLRNVSTVLVFDPVTLKIRFISTGHFTRQHDPAFIDGNTISVFDNNHTGPRDFGQQSRILLISALTGEVKTWYEGSESEPFYTDIMGKNQWLEDGSLLVTDSRNGRGFQLNADREIVWEYINLIDDGLVGLVEEVQRLPAELTPLFDTPQAERCAAP